MTNQIKKINPAVLIAKALLKSLFMAITIVIVSVIIIRINPKLGTLLMFTGSCLMVLLTARKRFLLNTLTCVLPGAMVLSCFILQMLLPMQANNLFSATGLIAGALVGGIMGLVHKINEENGRLIARRSRIYVLIWIITFLLTQATSLWGIEKIARIGLVLSGFSTAMLTAMSLTLLIRYRYRIGRLRLAMASSTRTLTILLLIFLSAFTTLTFAQTTRVNSAQEAVYKILSLQDLPGYKRSLSTMPFDTEGWIKKKTQQSIKPPIKDFGCNIFWIRREKAETFELRLYYFNSKSEANRFFNDPSRSQNVDEKSLSGYGDAARLYTWRELASLEMLHGQWLVSLYASPFSMHRPKNRNEQVAQQRRLNIRVQLCMNVIRKIDRRLDGIQYGTQRSSRQRQQATQPQQRVPQQRQQTSRQQQPTSRQRQQTYQQQPTSQQWTVPESTVDWEKYMSDELGEDAEDTGKAAAVIQLTFAVLMSTLMAGSEAASQAVAGLQSAAGSYIGKAAPEPPSPTTVPTQILDGQKAINWLQDRNMMDKDGNLTEKFNTWFDQSHSDTGSSDLEGFAGNINRTRPDGKEGPIAGSKLDGSIAIIVREQAPSDSLTSEPPSEPITTTPPSPESVTETDLSPEPDSEIESSPEPVPDSTLSPPETQIPSEETGPASTPTPSPVPGPLPKPESELELTPAWLKRNPLLSQNPNSMFTPDYMKNQIDVKFHGADSDKLCNSMNELAKNPQGQDLDNVLKSIADTRGRPLEEITSEYHKYQELLNQREKNYPGGTAELSSYLHPGFMGSTSQLRSGQIVGTAFGIDPVFGAMLNPTGGLVGPGNLAIDANNSAVGYHGSMHDAAGYLYKSHKVGPGYDYLRKDQPRDTASPLSGQSEGIRMWRETLGEKADITAEPAEHGIRYIVSAVDTADEAIRWGTDITDLEPAGNFLVENFSIF